MKITKFPQSCLLIETKDKKILIDPGTLKYKEEYFDIWNNVDVILITHKHSDHCNVEILEKLNKNIKIYSSSEVQSTYPSLNINIVKEGNIINFDNEIKIEVVHAEHGYIAPMKNGAKVVENIGYIIDDSDKKIYITSDTISFQNDYKCDVICLPVSDYGVVMGAFEAALFAKETDAKLVIPLHADSPKYPVNFDFVKEMFNQNELNYKILTVEIFEIKGFQLFF